MNRIPTIWLGVQSGELSAAFAELVAAESVVLYSANVKHRLRINAVPAAFLVGG